MDIWCSMPGKTILLPIGWVLQLAKKLGKAVIRNRVRRRLREVYRLNEAAFQCGYDIVVVARSKCVGAEFEKLTAAYLHLAKKAGILREDRE